MVGADELANKTFSPEPARASESKECISVATIRSGQPCRSLSLLDERELPCRAVSLISCIILERAMLTRLT